MTKYNVLFSMFFWLSFREDILIDILEKAGFEKLISDEAGYVIFPGIKVEPGPKTIAVYNGVKVKWNHHRFNLLFEGPYEEVLESVKKVIESFSNSDYKLEDILHFIEVIVKDKRLTMDNYIKSIRRKISFTLEIHDQKLRVFSLSLSNMEVPYSSMNFYQWFHISLEPDVNSPNKVLYIKIVRRFNDFKTAITFLEKLDEIFNSISNQLIR